MRIDDKKETPRQSMSWLHTWISLLLGWLLYVIFFTGTLSFFQNEISVWMKPELHQSNPSTPQQTQLHNALHYLNQNAKNAESWSIRFANERQPTIALFTREKGEDRHRGKEIHLNAETGEEIKARETRGGSFLYRFHFELYGIDRLWARWLVGIATLFMFVAIISGIIVHKKIFKDFFTFRPKKGQRSWLDAHNATAVFALPFHIMITFSGLLLFMYLLMPWAMNNAFSDRQTFFQALNSANSQQQQEQRHQNQKAQKTPDSNKKIAEYDQSEFLDSLLRKTQDAWKTNPIASLQITNPNTDKVNFEFRAARAENLLNRNAVPSMKFNLASNKALENSNSSEVDVPSAFYNLMTWLHLARGVEPILRWLLFFSGVMGTMMVATGLILWVIKRKSESKATKSNRIGNKIVESLNLATIVGLPIACSAYFIANRFIPVQMAERSLLEIKTFFLAWFVALTHAAIRKPDHAWREQLALSSILYFSLPFINFISGGRPLWSSVYHGQWMIASFDMVCFILSLIFMVSFIKLSQKQNQPQLKRQMINSGAI